MRVATRRLRSTLQSFGEVIPRSGTEPILAELKWLTGVLGEARDAEVLAARLAQNVRAIPAEQVLGPVAARVPGALRPDPGGRARQRAGCAGLGTLLRAPGRLDGLLADPPLSAEAERPAAQVLPGAARRTYQRTRRRMRRAGRTSPGHPRELAFHEARKAAKRARYAGEAISPALGKGAGASPGR